MEGETAEVYYNKVYEAERAVDEGQGMTLGGRSLKLMCPQMGKSEEEHKEVKAVKEIKEEKATKSVSVFDRIKRPSK